MVLEVQFEIIEKQIILGENIKLDNEIVKKNKSIIYSENSARTC
jgi:hypothetical protein